MHTIKISFITTWYGDWNIIKETKKKKRWDASTVGRLTAVSLRLICRRCVTMWYTTKLRSYGREYIQGNLEIRVNISRSLHTKNWNYARLKTIFHSCLTCASKYFIARLGVKSESKKVRRIPRIDLEFIFFLENCAQILKNPKRSNRVERITIYQQRDTPLECLFLYFQITLYIRVGKRLPYEFSYAV